MKKITKKEFEKLLQKRIAERIENEDLDEERELVNNWVEENLGYDAFDFIYIVDKYELNDIKDEIHKAKIEEIKDELKDEYEII